MNNKDYTTQSFRWLMLVISLSLSICHLSLSPVCAQTGTWKAYLSYYEPQQIIKGGNRLYVRASNSLYSYHLTDHSIVTYDKMRQLSDVFITHIAWSQEAKKLIIIYDNQNIDLLSADDTAENISALINNLTIQDKTVNAITISGVYAYLSTNFGIVKVNMKRSEIAESYILNKEINATAIHNNTRIYAKQSNGTVLTALLSDNLLNASNWQTAASVPDNLFKVDTSDWNQYLSIVQTLQPGGPRYNTFGFLLWKYNQLYTTGGADVETTATVQVLQPTQQQWNIFQEEGIKEQTKHPFYMAYALDIDPRDTTHVMVAARNGLYEYRNGRYVAYFNQDNSPIEAIYNDDQIVSGIYYDQSGQLWLLNSLAVEHGLHCIQTDGSWISPTATQLNIFTTGRSLAGLVHLCADPQGNLWFCNDNWVRPCFFSYNSTTKKLVRYGGQGNTGNNVINQDGEQTTVHQGIRQVVPDSEGNVWVATSQGLFLLDQSRVGEADTYLTQVKVPRNDGTDYADYLMAGIDITAIAIDGGNRKWIGTNENGLYLISDDNMEMVHHFTSDNSPLLSNNIQSLAIDGTTGEVFIGTDYGLCSFMSDATDPSDSNDNDLVYAFPNPVPADYNGLITIRGLSFNADVKILSTAGKLVARGRSNGGTWTWNGCDSKGQRVASGIYMIVSATNEGGSGVVGKVAIIN